MTIDLSGHMTEDPAPIPAGVIEETVDHVFSKRAVVGLAGVQPPPEVSLGENQAEEKLHHNTGGRSLPPLYGCRLRKECGGSRSLRGIEKVLNPDDFVVSLSCLFLGNFWLLPKLYRK